MKDRTYEVELTDPRVSYAARYENEGHADDRAAAVAARAARAMRDGNRSMDGTARDGSQGLVPRSPRSAPDRNHNPRARGHPPRPFLTMKRCCPGRQEAAEREAGA